MRRLIGKSPVGLAVPLVILLAGCSGNDSGTPPSTNTKTEEQEVRVTPITIAGYEETIRQLKGKVILVDFWFNT